MSYSTPTYNIRNYGARGDGAIDDSGAFVAAFAAISNQSAVLHIPKGTYLLQSPVTLLRSTSNKLQIVGEGTGSVIKIGLSNTHLFDVHGASAYAPIEFHNIHFTVHSSHTGADAFVNVLGYDIGFYDCHFNGLELVNNGIVTGTSTVGMDGFTLERCIFYDLGLTGTITDSVVGNGVWVRSTSLSQTPEHANYRFSQCVFRDCTSFGFFVTEPIQKCTIDSCVFDNNALTASTTSNYYYAVQHNMCGDAWRVTNNKYSWDGITPAIRLGDWDHTTLNSGTEDHLSGATIEGNVFINGNSDGGGGASACPNGIRIEMGGGNQCRGLTVQNNVFDWTYGDSTAEYVKFVGYDFINTACKNNTYGLTGNGMLQGFETPYPIAHSETAQPIPRGLRTVKVAVNDGHSHGTEVTLPDSRYQGQDPLTIYRDPYSATYNVLVNAAGGDFINGMSTLNISNKPVTFIPISGGWLAVGT